MANETQTVPRRRLRRFFGALAIALVVAFAALIGALAWLASESGLERALGELSARTGGALAFEGASGSLLRAMRARRVTYRDAHVDVVAEDVVLAWSPLALASRVLRIDELRAQRIVVTLVPSQTPSSPPDSLALPFSVIVAHAEIARLVLASGEATREFDNVALAYSGGATTHRVTDFALGSQWGSVRGEATLAAQSPFDLRGRFELAASERLARASANVDVGGRLTAVDVEAAMRANDATARASATVAPLAADPLVAAAIDAHDIDLSRFDAAWPRTRIAAKIDARADADRRYVGSLEATNAVPGAIDDARVPLAALRSRYALSRERLVLDDLAADFGAGGRASGRARIELTSNAALPPSEWDLTVRELDLARIYRPAIATRLAGTLRARIERGVQRVDADLAQGDRALAFAATISNDAVAVERFRARAGGGEAAGRGRFGLAGAHRYEIAATATHFDPARFFAAPHASLDGTVDATGELGARWYAEGRVDVRPTSRVAGSAASASARGRVSAHAIDNATIDARIGDASLHANGGYGRPGDIVSFALDVPRLATIAPLAGAHWPAGLAGGVRARGTLEGEPAALGGTIDGHADRLSYGDYSIGTLDVRASIAPGRASAAAPMLRPAERPLVVALDATGVRAPRGSFPKASLAIDGTLARHVATVALRGDDVDASARLEGGFASNATVDVPAWSGALASLDNRGAYALHLAAPARLAWSRDRIELGEASVAVADGTLRIAAFNWRDGRIDSRGRFEGVPVATVARIAGVTLPMRSTLVVGGDWDIAATPRLAGSLHVRRERGDVYTSVLTSGEVALGLSTFELAATIANDTIDATAAMRASTIGNATGTLTVGNVAGASAGMIPPDAPVTATLKAEIASLAPLQPMLGTSAVVDGRLSIDAAAHGTRRDLAVSGSLAASELRIAAPQYGVNWTNGRLRAKLADGTLALEELALDAGDGKFVASGTLVGFHGTAAGIAAATTSITWRAENFRALNRPDMRLVVDGRGTIGARDKRLLLAGELTAREGHFEIAQPTPYALGPDVVVAGVRREPPPDRFHNVPLAVEVDVDFGDRLDVTGRGVEARLAGRVHVATSASGDLLARGRIRTVTGTYVAFGQKLTIERGELIFDGPIDNPALDIVAVRRNLPVEAGVQLSGTVHLPRVVLVSDPPVPDGEKLSWLVLGQGLDRTSGTDAAALQAAAATLFGDSRAPFGATVARRFGLDDISIRAASTSSSSSTASGALGGQVLAVGKRLSDKVYIIYEQGLSVANNALKIEYVLTRNLTLRADAGVVSGVGIYYQRSFE